MESFTEMLDECTIYSQDETRWLQFVLTIDQSSTNIPTAGGIKMHIITAYKAW